MKLHLAVMFPFPVNRHTSWRELDIAENIRMWNGRAHWFTMKRSPRRIGLYCIPRTVRQLAFIQLPNEHDRRHFFFWKWMHLREKNAATAKEE